MVTGNTTWPVFIVALTIGLIGICSVTIVYFCCANKPDQSAEAAFAEFNIRNNRAHLAQQTANGSDGAAKALQQSMNGGQSSPEEKAKVEFAIAANAFAKGEFLLSHEHCQKALIYARNCKKTGSSEIDVFEIATDIANRYARRIDVKSVLPLEDALDISNCFSGTQSYKAARAHKAIGLHYVLCGGPQDKLEQYRNAATHMDKADEIFSSEDDSKSRKQADLNFHLYRALAHLLSLDGVTAAPIFETALANEQKLSPLQRAYLSAELGAAMIVNGDLSLARKLLDRAVEFHGGLQWGDCETRWSASKNLLQRLAHLLEENGRVSDASICIEYAIKLEKKNEPVNAQSLNSLLSDQKRYAAVVVREKTTP
jgi:hypothetical protein